MPDIIAVQLRRGRTFEALMHDYRVAVLQEAMAMTNYKQSEAARLLGVHKNTLNNWIKRMRREVGMGLRRVK